MKTKLLCVSVIVFMLICTLISCTQEHVHTYGEWEITKQATCTADGVRERDCACGDIQTAEVYATGHSFGSWEITQNATCTENGKEERFCNCGSIESREITATGHAFNSWETVSEATCTADGQEKRSCNTCGESETKDVSAKGHSFAEWVVISEATCAAEGEKQLPCSVCNYVKTEAIPKSTEHKYNNGKIIQDATCTSAGSKNVTCTICKASGVQSIDALGHNISSKGACTRCGLVILTLTEAQIAASKNVAKMPNGVTEYSSYIEIRIKFKDDLEYNLEIPVYVDVRIEDDDGNVLYSNTIIKKATQSSVKINHDDITPAKTNIGTIYYTVYNDYVGFREISRELKEIPWTVYIDLPSTPTTISYLNSKSLPLSSCRITEITYKISGDDVYFYFTGEKTFDAKGNNYSSSCYVGWKLYDSEGYMLKSGILITDALAVGERFKGENVTAYGCIEQGETYRLVISDVQ